MSDEPRTHDLADSIPEELREKLHALRPLLEEQGVVQRHGNGWRLRYRNHDAKAMAGVHRSLNLGDDDGVAIAVMALIEAWRKECVFIKQKFEKKARIKAEFIALHNLEFMCTNKRKTGRPKKSGLWHAKPNIPDNFVENYPWLFE